jgi:hypothetical protein
MKVEAYLPERVRRPVSQSVGTEEKKFKKEEDI